MHTLDWLIFAAPFVFVTLLAVVTRRYVRSVADFLAAGRLAGRYLVANAEGAAALGAITIIAAFEMFFKAGGTVGWWQTIQTPVWLLVTLSGFIVYRYRETRALTMAEFLERRYSRPFRVFMGALAWVSGLINYGLFPIVGAKFFVLFLDLPFTLSIAGLAIPTHIIVMAVLLMTNLVFVSIGGQLTAMVTDCVEGLIAGLFFLAIMLGIMWVFDWSQMSSALLDRPPGRSFANPFDAWEFSDFNIWFVLIGVFAGVYSYMAWQGNSGFNASAASPHEAKMGRILGQWRGYARGAAITLLGIAAITYMHHPDFASGAARVNANVAAIAGQVPPSQAVVPMALRDFLPIGLKGMFAAIMLFAIMACDASYMHSWGSIFVQDVILPVRQAMGRAPLTPTQHLRWLRVSVLGVAVFAFLFGVFYQQNDYIMMFFAITGAIFLGGAGSCIIGGLYWKRGTTAGAWASMIVGATLAVGGIVARQIYHDFPINGQWMSMIAMSSAIGVYVLLSFITSRQPFNMDKLLHRGMYRVDPVTGEPLPAVQRPPTTWRTFLGIDAEFSRGDKVQSALLAGWSLTWFALFLVITIWNVISPWPSSWWGHYMFCTCVVLAIAVTCVTTVWFTWGGVRDLSRLLRDLRKLPRNRTDDGRVSTDPARPAGDAKLSTGRENGLKTNGGDMPGVLPTAPN